jgi:CheY-like chemotaxis protein
MNSRLLLIEDDEVAAYVTCKLLRQCGFVTEINVVKDGREALDYLSCEGRYAHRSPENPSLIVLDLKMPNLDGFEVLKHIRSTPKLSGIPVFILSASETKEDVCRSHLLGISRYMVKPLDVAEFTPEVTRVLATASPNKSLNK